jgi:hypothetical protein
MFVCEGAVFASSAAPGIYLKQSGALNLSSEINSFDLPEKQIEMNDKPEIRHSNPTQPQNQALIFIYPNR